MMLTIPQLNEKLAGCYRALQALNLEAPALSLAVASGDQVAVDRLAEINAQIEQLTVDRGVLEKAIRQARVLARQAAEKQAAERRAAYMAEARALAGGVIELAGKADEANRAVAVVLTEIRATEAALHAALRQAEDPVNVGVVGRQDLAAVAAQLIIGARDHRGFAQPTQTVRSTALQAWSYLLMGEAAE